MKFSILVPVYNVEKYVEECIQSVLSQTFKNYELILVDDGSTDCSGKICDSYAANFSQIKVYHKPNAGLIHTRRYGISKASGEWYIFLDSDDTLNRNALETINRYIDNTDCVIYGFEKVLEDKVILIEHDAQVLRTNNKNQIYRKFFVDGGYNALWRKAIKSTLVRKTDYSNYYHISMGEDLLQSLEILENCKTVTFIPEVLYRYRVNPNSITQSVKFENYCDDIPVQTKVLQFIRTENVFGERDFDAFRDRCLDGIIFGNLVTITNFKTTLENRLSLYKRLKSSEYYLEFLSKGYSKGYKRWKRKFVFGLFKRNIHLPLLMILKK